MSPTVPAAPALLAVGSLVLPASARPPKPITKTYTATAAPGVLSFTAYCDTTPTTHDKHLEPFKAPAKGTLKLTLTQSAGDWDAMLLDASGAKVAESAEISVDPESYSYKIKKAGEFTLMSCNALGGPTAEVTYPFTFTP